MSDAKLSVEELLELASVAIEVDTRVPEKVEYVPDLQPTEAFEAFLRDYNFESGSDDLWTLVPYFLYKNSKYYPTNPLEYQEFGTRMCEHFNKWRKRAKGTGRFFYRLNLQKLGEIPQKIYEQAEEFSKEKAKSKREKQFKNRTPIKIIKDSKYDLRKKEKDEVKRKAQLAYFERLREEQNKEKESPPTKSEEANQTTKGEIPSPQEGVPISRKRGHGGF